MRYIIYVLSFNGINANKSNNYANFVIFFQKNVTDIEKVIPNVSTATLLLPPYSKFEKLFNQNCVIMDGVVTDNSGKNKQGGNPVRSESVFYSVIPVVLSYEGGFADNPLDRGGRTNMGITQPFLGTYRKRAGVNAVDVASLTKDEAIRLYKAFWDACGFRHMDNADIAKLVYDFSVNSGSGIAIKCLQRLLNSKGQGLMVDGRIGEKTNNAVNSVDEAWLKREYQLNRANHCDSIVDRHPEQRVFIKGWFRRINDIGRLCGCDTVFRSRHMKV